MTEQKTPEIYLPPKVEILEKELKEKIAERIKQANELKIKEKALLIAEQLGRKKIRSRFWNLWNYVFRKGEMYIKCFQTGSWVEIKWARETVYYYNHGVETFNPSKEWLNILNKYYKKALECREKEMKGRFGLE